MPTNATFNPATARQLAIDARTVQPQDVRDALKHIRSVAEAGGFDTRLREPALRLDGLAASLKKLGWDVTFQPHTLLTVAYIDVKW